MIAWHVFVFFLNVCILGVAYALSRILWSAHDSMKYPNETTKKAGLWITIVSQVAILIMLCAYLGATWHETWRHL
jgi:hypothetical protein